MAAKDVLFTYLKQFQQLRIEMESVAVTYHAFFSGLSITKLKFCQVSKRSSIFESDLKSLWS